MDGSRAKNAKILARIGVAAFDVADYVILINDLPLRRAFCAPYDYSPRSFVRSFVRHLHSLAREA